MKKGSMISNGTQSSREMDSVVEKRKILIKRGIHFEYQTPNLIANLQGHLFTSYRTRDKVYSCILLWETIIFECLREKKTNNLFIEDAKATKQLISLLIKGILLQLLLWILLANENEFILLSSNQIKLRWLSVILHQRDKTPTQEILNAPTLLLSKLT